MRFYSFFFFSQLFLIYFQHKPTDCFSGLILDSKFPIFLEIVLPTSILSVVLHCLSYSTGGFNFNFQFLIEILPFYTLWHFNRQRIVMNRRASGGRKYFSIPSPHVPLNDALSVDAINWMRTVYHFSSEGLCCHLPIGRFDPRLA